MRLSLTFALAIAAAVVASQPIGADMGGVAVGIRGFGKRDNAPENRKPEENKPQPPPPEQRPAAEKHDEPRHEEPHHEEPHRDVHPPSNGQPEHIHIEHTEHPGGNPNNVEHFSQEIVNRPHEHSNVIKHVSMSGNHIQGKPTAHIVSGTNGISISGKGNTVVTDNLKGGEVVQAFGPDGGVILVQTGKPAPPPQRQPDSKPRRK
ncbi:hypothetical protein IWW36_001893 [Coemansia brasiliensis]|uniref:Uncharacterized protein n=1 Tax=Coemansia brasiliensis TaxID=2650707 RepID=A0A9W8IFX0_9FUNG|nr:hypothetical protein IWW36_001893 [Coemansia brasiliensis]